MWVEGTDSSDSADWPKLHRWSNLGLPLIVPNEGSGQWCCEVGGMGEDDLVAVGATAGGPLLFREVQRFRQWFFWLPVLIVTGVVWWQFVEQVIMGRPQGTEPIPDWLAWLLTIVFGLGFPAFTVVARLITEVRPGLLAVRLVPFRFKRIYLRDVASAEAREYSAMREYGGWGIRFSRHGKAYNASGNQGVQLVLTDGSRILIGTQQPMELLGALRSAGAGAR